MSFHLLALCALAAHTGSRFLGLTWDSFGENCFLVQETISFRLCTLVCVWLAAERDLDNSWNNFDFKNRMEDLFEAATAPRPTHDLLETAECLCCHIRRTDDRRPTSIAAVACRTLLQH